MNWRWGDGMKANRPIIVWHLGGNVRHGHRTETSDNRLMFREKRPMPVAKPTSRHLSPIYHQTAISHHPGTTPKAFPHRESSSNRQTEIANRQPIGKRFSLIGKPTAIVRSVTGQFQALEAERVEREATSCVVSTDNRLTKRKK